MQEIIRFLNPLLSIKVFKNSLIFSHLNQIMLEGNTNAIVMCYLFQCLAVLWYSEHHCSCLDVFDVDWKHWFGENGSSAFELLSQFSCLLGVVMVVN